MKIHFSKIHYYNFLSLGDVTLELKDKGFVVVHGTNNSTDDNAVSNGSGKSSLWDGLSWVLTGSTIRGTKDIVNFNRDGGAFVELEFSVDNKNYSILRSKDHEKYKTNLRIVENGVDKSGKGIRESEKVLQELLPDLTASLLGSVVILGQGLPMKFSNNTPSGRKEVLEKLSQSDFMIEDIKSRISQRKTTLSEKQRDFEDRKLKTESEKNFASSKINQTRQALENLGISNEIQAVLDKYTQEEALARSQIDIIAKGIESCEVQCNEAFKELSDLQQNSDRVSQDISEKYKSSIQDIDSTISAKKVIAESLNTEIRKISSIVDVCPTCGQKIPNVSKPSCEQQKAEFAELNTLIQSLNEQKQSIENKKKAEMDEFRLSVDRARKEADARYQEIRTRKQNLSDSLAKERSNLTSIQSLIKLNNDLINEYETKKSFYNSEIDSYNNILQRCDQDILYISNELSDVKEHQEVITKFETAVKRDFRGCLLSSVISFIDQQAKKYCKIVFNHEKISFTQEGNDISILFNSKYYENLSGGEKQKIDLIIQFSLRDMLSSCMNFTSNIIVLDEVFDNLDFDGCQKIVDLISSLDDIESVFVVTHRNELSIPSDSTITVVKSSDGISEIL